VAGLGRVGDEVGHEAQQKGREEEGGVEGRGEEPVGGAHQLGRHDERDRREHGGREQAVSDAQQQAPGERRERREEEQAVGHHRQHRRHERQCHAVTCELVGRP
jgi:hypothetical protein